MKMMIKVEISKDRKIYGISENILEISKIYKILIVICYIK